MPNSAHPQYSPQIVEITQRLFRLKNRFKVGIPEDLANLRKRIHQSKLDGKAGGVSDFDTFYNAGIVFSRHSGPISMGELSHDMDIPLSSATRIMDWFVANEYAQRLPDPQDRRVVRVVLTETGLETYRTIHDFFMENIERVLSNLEPEERKTFHRLLCKVLDAFEKEN
jgi:DNA-binding MarR family transcriptional regulator